MHLKSVFLLVIMPWEIQRILDHKMRSKDELRSKLFATLSAKVGSKIKVEISQRCLLGEPLLQQVL